MKNVILFVSFVLAVCFLRDAESRRYSLEEIRENLQPVKKICIERVGVDPKLIDDANKGKFTPDRKLKCYFKCLMLMTKAMSKDDKIQETTFIKTAEVMMLEENIDPIMEAFMHCAPITRKPLEGCDLAYELAKCYLEYNPKLNFYP